MEFYTYVNIFETKGLEYLLLMAFFVLFVLLLRYLSSVNGNHEESGNAGRAQQAKRGSIPEAAKHGRG